MNGGSDVTPFEGEEASKSGGRGSRPGIFISCSMDSKSLPILHALIFTARICGLEPSHIGFLGAEDSSRPAEVKRLVSSSELSVHDISDGSDDPESSGPAANVSFELGMALASGAGRRLILAREPYEHLKSFSNINGQDVVVHGGDPRRASLLLRNWLAGSTGRRLPGPQAIWKKYRKFLTDMPHRVPAMFGKAVEALTLKEWDMILSFWLQDELEVPDAPESAQATDRSHPADAESPAPVRSSAWTGLRPLGEQLTIVQGIAPLARQSLELLIQAIDEKRYNDPVTADALQALRDLHAALGELIARADASLPMHDIFVRIETHKERLKSAVREGAQVMITAPALAVGASYMLSLLSGFPVSDAMLSTLCATMMGKDALLALAGRGSKDKDVRPQE